MSHRPVPPPDQRRRSIRLPSFDYRTSGAYFVTIVTAQRTCIFGNVVDDRTDLSTAGQIAETEWVNIAAHRDGVEIDEYVVMPNHVHGILWLMSDGGAIDDGMTSHAHTQRRFGWPQAGSLGTIIAGYKAGVTRRLRDLRVEGAVWQRGFYEHIVRNDAALSRIRKYILDNPAKWADDDENPNRHPL